MSKPQITLRVSEALLAKIDKIKGEKNSRSYVAETLISSAIRNIEQREEARKRKSVTLRVEPELHQALTNIAASRGGQSIQETITALLKTAILIEASAAHTSAIKELSQTLTKQTEHHHQQSQLQAKITQELLVTMLHKSGLDANTINELIRDAKQSAIKALKEPDD